MDEEDYGWEDDLVDSDVDPELSDEIAYVQSQLKIKKASYFTSLENLCLNVIYESLLRLPSNKELSRQILNLSPALVNLVSKTYFAKVGASRSYFDWKEIQTYACHLENVRILAEGGLKELDCSSLQELPQDEKLHLEKQLFQRLPSESLKLETFKDERYLKRCPFFKNAILSDHYALHHMTNLVNLQINHFPAKCVDLKIISLFLPLLQCLQLNAEPDAITHEGLEHLSNLTKLKQLTFEAQSFNRNPSCYEALVDLVKTCLLILPKVDTQANFAYNWKAHHEFPSFKEPVVLELEQLVVHGNSSIPPSNVTVPKVSKITIHDFPPSEPSFLHQLERLRELKFIYRYNKICNVYETLGSVGRQLGKLSVTGFETGNLQQVLQLCPNLYYLEFEALYFEGNMNLSLLKNLIKQMRCFILKCSSGYSEYFFDSQGLLHLLLTSCPDLEELDIFGLRLRHKELDILVDKVTSAGAFVTRKLEKVSIESTLATPEECVKFVLFATQFCVQNCNILKECHFEYYHGSFEHFPDCDMNVLYCAQKMINNFKLEPK